MQTIQKFATLRTTEQMGIVVEILGDAPAAQ